MFWKNLEVIKLENDIFMDVVNKVTHQNNYGDQIGLKNSRFYF